MKRHNGMIIWIWAICTIFLALPATVSALTLSLETTDASGTPKTAFMANEELRVAINIDNPTEVAGAAFTLLYDPNVVIPPTTNAEGIADPAVDVDGSWFPFTFENGGSPTPTHRENTEKDQAQTLTGKIYLSGAAINESTGGPKPMAATPTALFTVKFTVKPGIAVGTNFNFQLVQTELMNEAAGYGNDVDDDGIFNVGDGDTKDKVPVLVGARAQGENGFENFDCSNPPCAFPVLLSETTDPAFATLTAPCTVTDGPKWNVTGTVNYAGNQTGTVYMGVFNSATPGDGSLVKAVEATLGVETTIPDVPQGTGYYLAAFRDSDGGTDPGGGVIDVDPAEAQGMAAGTFDLTAAVTGLVVNLTDPDGNSDGMPDYWVALYPGIGAAGDDFDNDGYTNLFEFENGYNPTDSNSPGVQLLHFTGIASGNTNCFFVGTLTISGTAANKATEIGVYTPGGVLVGAAKVLDDTGAFNVAAKGGAGAAAAGDVLTFKVWDANEDTEIVISSGMITPQVYGSYPAVESNPPVWTADNDIWGMDIDAVLSQVIPLKEGWNLFSFSVNNVYHKTDYTVIVPTLSNTTMVPVVDLDTALSSISGKYDLIVGVDVENAKTYDPNFTLFNTLHYLASGYGYWIKMNQDANLVLSGARASASDTLQLQSGWNLVGCWHSEVRYVSASAPTVDFPEGTQKVVSADLDADVFGSISGFYSLVVGVDANNAYTFDPNFTLFNTLDYVGPGYGYWIKLTEAREIHY